MGFHFRILKVFDAILIYQSDSKAIIIKSYQVHQIFLSWLVVETINLFGLSFGATLITIIGVLIEVLVMLSLVKIARSLYKQQSSFFNSL